MIKEVYLLMFLACDYESNPNTQRSRTGLMVCMKTTDQLVLKEKEN